MAQDASVNSGAGPGADSAPDRVARTQIKYHRGPRPIARRGSGSCSTWC